jgi:pyruvate/2-oxoglutarate/acetoin dehydrogenase E1 component
MTKEKGSTILEAVHAGIREAMSQDERVFVIGEDVGRYGGAFKVTEGLLDTFGEDRVIDTPISEAAIVGAACGAALMGMKPIAEFQISLSWMRGDRRCISRTVWIRCSGRTVPLAKRGIVFSQHGGLKNGRTVYGLRR